MREADHEYAKAHKSKKVIEIPENGFASRTKPELFKLS
jgi:hypothetical protein